MYGDGKPNSLVTVCSEFLLLTTTSSPTLISASANGNPYRQKMGLHFAPVSTLQSRIIFFSNLPLSPLPISPFSRSTLILVQREQLAVRTIRTPTLDTVSSAQKSSSHASTPSTTTFGLNFSNTTFSPSSNRGMESCQ